MKNTTFYLDLSKVFKDFVTPLRDGILDLESKFISLAQLARLRLDKTPNQLYKSAIVLFSTMLFLGNSSEQVAAGCLAKSSLSGYELWFLKSYCGLVPTFE